MATLSKTIGGIEYTAETLKAKFIELGVSESKFNDRESFNMPKSGTFYDFEILDVKNADGSIRNDLNNKPMKNIRLKFKSNDGDGSISLSRLLAYGKIKENPNHELTENDVKFSDRTKKFYIKGETLNPAIPSSAEKATLELIGKRFKCDEVTLFALPYEFIADDEKHLIKNVTTQRGFKFTLA